MPTLRIALAQVDPTVGDLAGNVALVRGWTRKAAEAGAHLVAFPEMMLTGYPVEDLVFRESFVAASKAALAALAADLAEDGLGDTAVVVGYLDADGTARISAEATPGRGPRNALAVLHRGASSPPTSSTTCPTTASSTRTGTSCRATRCRWSALGGRRRRADHLRGPLAGRRAVRRRRAGQGRAGGQHQRLAVRARQGRRAAAAGAPAGRRGAAPPSRTSTWSAARTSWSSTATRWSWRRTARCWPGPPSSPRSCSSSTSTCRPRSDAAAARPARPRCGVARTVVPGELAPRSATRGPTGADRAAGRRTRPRCGRRWCSGCATTSARTGSARSSSPSPVASTRPSWRRSPSTRSAPSQVYGVSMPSDYSSAALQGRRGRPGQAHRPALPRRADPADGRRVPVQHRALRAGGGEPPGPGARGDPDGAVQPGQPPRAHHRQQERAGGRATPPSTATRSAASTRSRTCRRRSCGGWPSGATPRRSAAARRRRSRRTPSPSRPAPSCGRASSTPTRCPTTTSSTRSWPTTSTATSAATGCWRPATTRPLVDRVLRMVDLAEYKRRQSAPGPKISIKAFGRDRRLPITNRFRELASGTSERPAASASARPSAACDIFHARRCARTAPVRRSEAARGPQRRGLEETRRQRCRTELAAPSGGVLYGGPATRRVRTRDLLAAKERGEKLGDAHQLRPVHRRDLRRGRASRCCSSATRPRTTCTATRPPCR